nr:ORF3 [Torque teno felis virus]
MSSEKRTSEEVFSPEPHYKDSLDRLKILTSEDRSPGKNVLRGMLTRRSMMKQGPRPKRVKRSAHNKAVSKRLFDILGADYSESELSDTASTTSSNPF